VPRSPLLLPSLGDGAVLRRRPEADRIVVRAHAWSLASAWVTLVFGIWPGPLVTLAQHATVLSRREAYCDRTSISDDVTSILTYRSCSTRPRSRIEGSMCVWNDRSSSGGLRAHVIRSTWDYTRDREGISLGSGIERLFNRIRSSSIRRTSTICTTRGSHASCHVVCDVGANRSFRFPFVVKRRRRRIDRRREIRSRRAPARTGARTSTARSGRDR